MFIVGYSERVQIKTIQGQDAGKVLIRSFQLSLPSGIVNSTLSPATMCDETLEVLLTR